MFLTTGLFIWTFALRKIYASTLIAEYTGHTLAYHFWECCEQALRFCVFKQYSVAVNFCVISCFDALVILITDLSIETMIQG